MLFRMTAVVSHIDDVVKSIDTRGLETESYEFDEPGKHSMTIEQCSAKDDRTKDKEVFNPLCGSCQSYQVFHSDIILDTCADIRPAVLFNSQARGRVAAKHTRNVSQ